MIALCPFHQLRLARGAEHLHRLGPRAIAEFLAEGAGPDLAALLARLDRYRRLHPDAVRLVGGDRFPRRLPLVVPR